MADLLLTYPELTHVFPVAEGTLRSWVSQDDIKPRAVRGRRKAFHHDDIQRAYDRRHPEPEESTMGNWHIAIDGHGVHDNGLDHDAEQRLKAFVHQLLADGHQVHHATITVGGARELVPSSPDAPAHYKYLP